MCTWPLRKALVKIMTLGFVHTISALSEFGYFDYFQSIPYLEIHLTYYVSLCPYFPFIAHEKDKMDGQGKAMD